MVFIIETQNFHSANIKTLLEDRKKQSEPLFSIDHIKSLEIINLPKILVNENPKTNTKTIINNKIKDLKDLCLHLSSLVTILSALYSYILAKNIQSEFISEERAEIICTLLANIKLNKAEFSRSKDSKILLRKNLIKNEKIIEKAAVVIQRFYRKIKKKEVRKKAFIEEYVKFI